MALEIKKQKAFIIRNCHVLNTEEVQKNVYGVVKNSLIYLFENGIEFDINKACPSGKIFAFNLDYLEELDKKIISNIYYIVHGRIEELNRPATNELD